MSDPTGVMVVGVTAVMVMLAPGGIAAAILGFRGIGIVGAAAPLSLAGIALLSLTETVFPLPWTPMTWVLSAAFVVGAAVVVRRIVLRHGFWYRAPGFSRLGETASFLAVVVAAVAIAARLLPSLGGDAISQTFDNVYHLNAVRYIEDTGRISPTHQIIPGFYPSLWHAVTATVAMVSGGSIPLAVNVTSMVLAAVVWPISVVFLTRQIVGVNVTAMLTAGALSAGMAGFPMMMLDYGVLYPNVLSIALLPAVLALFLPVAGVGDGDRGPTVVRVLALLSAVTVLALAHPSTLMAFFAIGIWPALHGGFRWFRSASASGSRFRLRGGLVLWALGLLVVGGLLLVARPTSEQAFWKPSSTVPEAMQDVVLGTMGWRPENIVPTIAVLLGIIAILALRRRWWWLIAGWLTIAGTFVVCAGFPDGAIRYGLTGTWYSDLFRIVALLPTVTAPLGAIGVAFTVSTVLVLLRVRDADIATVLGVGAAAVVLLATQTGAQMTAETSRLADGYRLSDDSALLTTDEAALIARLSDHVPRNEVIAGSPWTGTSLSYALADRAALIPHIYQVETPDIALLSDRLDRAAEDPEVCAAVKRTGVRWVLDFGRTEVHTAEHPYPGFTELDSAPGFELVDQEGPDARLYRITACD